MDIEADFTSKPCSERYYGLFDEPGQFERFQGLCKKFSVKLSSFVVGDVLRDRPDYIMALQETGGEFGSHSLTHDLTSQTSEKEVKGGIEHFANHFGYLPLGYRSPRGKYDEELLKMLEREEVKYDSSVIPSVRPGVYSNLEKPTAPFRWKELSLIEIPISVTSGLRVPMALSYIKVLGHRFFNILGKRTTDSDPLIFLLHPMDLVYSDAAFAKLSAPWAAAYSRNRSRSWQLFELFLQGLTDSGYEFVQMSEIFHEAESMNLVEVGLD